MTSETSYIKKFNQLLHYKSRNVVKQILEEYLHTSYRSKNWSNAKKLSKAAVMSYIVTYEHYWSVLNDHHPEYIKNMLPPKDVLPPCYHADAKRQIIYVAVNYGDGTSNTLRLSARNIKKYIRNTPHLQEILLKN